jgi:hypothetical protein
VDPEVVTQFNSLQQTGNYVPSGGNPPPGGGARAPSAPAMSGGTARVLSSTDAFFALMGTQGDSLGSMEILPTVSG